MLPLDLTLDDVEVILVADKVLIKPRSAEERTKAGLFLPPGVQEKEKIYAGYVIKVGPGYPIPAVMDYDEPWKKADEKIQYVPLQAREGDLAVYIQRDTYPVEIAGTAYVIVPHSSILLLIRDEHLLE